MQDIYFKINSSKDWDKILLFLEDHHIKTNDIDTDTIEECFSSIIYESFLYFRISDHLLSGRFVSYFKDKDVELINNVRDLKKIFEKNEVR